MTPQPTGTAAVSAVLDRNLFRPLQGQPLQLDLKPEQDGHVTVRVFDVAGSLVRPLFEADLKAGTWMPCYWDGRNADGERVASGVYILSIQGGGMHQLLKVIVLN
jgi:hypothetical protein